MSRFRRFVVAVFALAVLAVPAAASAQPLLAITVNKQLLSFDSASPGTVTTQTISGLIDPTESILGMDRRPATGQVYVLTSAAGATSPAVVHLYVLNPVTAQLSLVGNSPPATGFADVPSGIDFNPAVDRLRLVNVNDANLRFNPSSGALAATDTDISPSSDLVDVAYDVLPAGATATTVYALDRATSTLVRLGGVNGLPQSPNGGVLTTIGPLGVTLTAASVAGFDISPVGTPFAGATVGGTTSLFTITLASGAMTAVGAIGAGTSQVVGLTALPDPAALPTGPAGSTGAAGATGPAGAPGPAGLPGVAGTTTFRDRLLTLLADDRLTGRAKRTLTVTVVSTIGAVVSLELRKGTTSVRKIAATVKAGRTRIKITKLPAAGRYTLRLTATGGDQRTTDQGTLTIGR
jgi:hypothetical protein